MDLMMTEEHRQRPETTEHRQRPETAEHRQRPDTREHQKQKTRKALQSLGDITGKLAA